MTTQRAVSVTYGGNNVKPLQSSFKNMHGWHIPYFTMSTLAVTTAGAIRYDKLCIQFHLGRMCEIS